MDLQDKFLQALLTIGGGADVSLAASYVHDSIGFPEQLHVFLPDIHLLTNERRAAFPYSTNYEKLLTSLVLRLKQFRVEAGTSQVTVYQLGDLLDLWRQGPEVDHSLDLGAWIANDHQDLTCALEDEQLGTRFTLGNHDLNLSGFPNFSAWQICHYLADSGGTASAIALHGHQFDWQQLALDIFLPERLKDAIVCLLSPLWPEGKHELGELIPLNDKQEKSMAPAFPRYIQAPQPVRLGKMIPVSGSIPPRFNIQTVEDQVPNGMKYAAAARDLCQQLNQQYQHALKMAVIGHTHWARIAVLDESSEHFFMLLDCGAWIEEYSTPESAQPLGNAQIGAIGCNQARIYQLSPVV
jgi:UDP-2,3-diacylglucosamine pyrophosphatase LpxH